jgi:hypothetical protein
MCHSDGAYTSPHSRGKVQEVSMQRDPSPGRRELCDSPSEGTRFLQSWQSRPEHPGASDGNLGCCLCVILAFFLLVSDGNYIPVRMSWYSVLQIGHH